MHTSLRTKSTSYTSNNIDTLYVTLLSLHRICQRWNQTGQKFAGADDISQSFLSKEPILLWILVVATYSRPLRHIRRASSRFLVTVFAVCSIALAFKLSFTIQDAPELLSPSISRMTPFLSQFSLLFQARCVFLGLLAILTLYIYDRKTKYPAISSTGMWQHSISFTMYEPPTDVYV